MTALNYRSLASAVIAQAIRDLSLPEYYDERQSAEQFFEGRDFSGWAQVAECNVEAIWGWYWRHGRQGRAAHG